jgi:hypothetical protein
MQKELLLMLRNARTKAGVLRPGSAQLVKPKPPVDDSLERPMILSGRSGSVTLRSALPNESSGGIWVQNESAFTVPFLFVVVPKTFVDMGSLPWKSLAAEFVRVLTRTS